MFDNLPRFNPLTNHPPNLNFSKVIPKSGYHNQHLAKAQYISSLNCHDLKVVAIDNQRLNWL